MSESSFPARLAYLRKERGLSQKQVAGELNISQALLSHYERGIRECSLSFLVSAAKFYNVSTDYLLGLTMEKQPGSYQNDDVEIVQSGKRGSLSAAMAKRLIINSIEIIFDIVEKCTNRDLSITTTDYFSLNIYKYFRHLYNAGSNPSGGFTLGDDAFPLGADAGLHLCEMRLLQILSGNKRHGRLTPLDKTRIPALTNDYLTAMYPKQSSSLLNVLHNADSKCKDLTKFREKSKG